MIDNVKFGEALEICKKLYDSLSGAGFYPALTGGQLYKDGARKDIDIVIYRHRQQQAGFEMEDLEKMLIGAGLSEFKYFGFVTKCKYKDISIDLFNPETSADDNFRYEDH